MSTDAKLPSGRRATTGLTRDDVVSNQRRRMLFAMAEAVAERGYAEVAVKDVITGAAVSRATFYEQFIDKQDCFLAAYDLAVETLLGTLQAVLPESSDPSRFRLLFAAYLEALIANQAFARVFLIDVYAAGPEAFRRRAASQQRFTELIAELFGVQGANGRFACEALVAAISSMVTTKLAERDVDGLRGLVTPVTRLAETLLG